MSRWDVIVIGAGGAGSAAMFHLARRGARVLGIDRFAPPHGFGSSHGQTRIIRQAYFEHPDYVPLLQRAYQLWAELEQARQAKLFHRVGLVETGPPDGAIVPAVLASAAAHQLPVQRWTLADCRQRFPALHLPEDHLVVFEENAGFLLVEECVAAHLDAAREHGAACCWEEVQHWRADDEGVTVTTDRGEHQASRLVLTPGPGAAVVLADLPLRWRVLRKHLHWHPTSDSSWTTAPTFFVELPGQQYFYGFPPLDGRGVKVAEHSGGQQVANAADDDRSVDPQERRRVEGFLRSCLPTLELLASDHAVCHYTMTPDEHFVVDRHPASDRVHLAAGLSGHGFKFAPVLGEILADLTLTGATELPIEFLSLKRI